jgi:hypothetical protein
MLNSNYFYKVGETKGKNDEIPMELDVQTNIEPRIEKKIQPDQTFGENERFITSENIPGKLTLSQRIKRHR